MIRNNNLFRSLEHEPKYGELNEATKTYFSKLMAGQEIIRRKNPAADLRFGYKKALEVAILCSLALVLVISQASRAFSIASNPLAHTELVIQVADIPVTEQFFRPPPPPRPSIPVPTESELIPEDVTIASTEIDLSDIPPAPPPPSDDEYEIFIAYDEPPAIIGGMASLQKHLRYPRIAQAASIEGTVFVKVLVSPQGETERAEVLKSTATGMGFEESAISALQKVRWKPAKQRDRNIRVWISIPVQFKLVDS